MLRMAILEDAMGGYFAIWATDIIELLCEKEALGK
jgi:hypothetical protein